MATTEQIIAAWYSAWRTNVTANNPSTGLHKPKLSDIRPLIDMIMAAVVAAAGGIKLLDTWTDLSAVVGTIVGQQAIVPLTDAGTHTDPVVGGTVANAGEYAWSASPAGWQWIRAEPELDIVTVASGPADSGKAIGAGASGKFAQGFLPALFQFLDDAGQYGGTGDGLRNWLGVADTKTGELVGVWPKMINDLAKRPSPQPIVYLAGDSRADQCSLDYSTELRGWLWWLGFLTGWRFDFQPTQNYGVAGSNSYELMAQAVSLITQPPGIVICITSTNDRTSTTNIITGDQTIMNLETFEYMVTVIGGHRLIWINDTPRGDGLSGSFSAGLTDNDRRGDHLAVAQWFRQRGENKGVYVADTWPLMVNPTDTLSRGLDTLYYDGLHPGPNGGYMIAQAVAPIITTILPPRPRLPSSQYDRYSATNVRGNLIDNGFMIGTTGTVNSPAAGVLAQDWTVDCGSGLVATCSKIAVGDGTSLQQVVLTGTPSGSSTTGPPLLVDAVSAVFSYTIDTADLLEGEIIEALAYVEYDGADGSYAGLRGIPLYIEYTAGGVDGFVCGGEPNLASNGSFPNLRMPAVNMTGIQMTPRLTIPASLTAAAVVFKVVPRGGEAVNAIVRFGQVAVRKIVDLGTGIL